MSGLWLELNDITICPLSSARSEQRPCKTQAIRSNRIVGSTNTTNTESYMHYRNGREAKNGDKIVKLDGGKVVAFGVLHSAGSSPTV